MTAPSSRRICFVTADVIGPVRNGGVGAACTNLAELLRAAGHEVTILFTEPGLCEEADLAHWIGHYARAGIGLVPLPAASPPAAVANPELKVAHDVFRWLLGQRFDIVHFHEWRGHGFVTLQAKRTSAAFAETLLCVTCHGPGAWHRAFNAELALSIETLETDFMERRSVALADHVFSPSAYLLDWMRAQGWDLPPCTEMRANVLPPGPAVPRPPARAAIREIVFFGRLEVRKGIELFCRAVELAGIADGNAISFLGKPGVIWGRPAAAWLADRVRGWPSSPRVQSALGRDAALAYLSGGGRLAVVPSLSENSPYAVAECLDRGIPVLAADVGGIAELIEPTDRPTVLFAGRPEALAARLREALAEGVRPGRPAIEPAALRRLWADWHATATAPVPADAPSSMPLVSICVTHRDRPAMLRRAMHSMLAQDYPNLEFIIVDDGSSLPESKEVLHGFAADSRIAVIRRDHGFPGAARNTGARQAGGRYLMFFDDDNIADVDLVSALVEAAHRTGAPIITCAHRVFVDGNQPGPDSPAWIPLGGAVAVGLYRNMFGDTVGLIDRELFLRLGGFTEDPDAGHEDWEFFAMAAQQGTAIEVVPRPLYSYRRGHTGITGGTSLTTNLRRSLRPYQAAVPPQLAPALELAVGLSLVQLKPETVSWRRHAVQAARALFHDRPGGLRLLDQAASIYRRLRR